MKFGGGGVFKKIKKTVNKTKKKVQKTVKDVSKEAGKAAKDAEKQAKKISKDVGKTVNKTINTVDKTINKGVNTVNKGVNQGINTINRGVNTIGRDITKGINQGVNTITGIPRLIDRNIINPILNQTGNEINSIFKGVKREGRALRDIAVGAERYVEHKVTDTIADGEDYVNNLIFGGNGSDGGSNFFSDNLLPFAAAIGSVVGGFYFRSKGNYILGSALIGGGVGIGITEGVEGGLNSLPLIGSFEFVQYMEQVGLLGGFGLGAIAGGGASFIAQAYEETESRVVGIAKSEEGKAAASSALDIASKIAPTVGAAALLL